jgi:PRC-barrel domain
MTFPSIEAARGWSGLTAVDSDDEPLGRITDIYLDRDTGQPEWALLATAQRRRTFVPLAGAARKRDRVAVAVPKAAVSDAPAVRPGRELSDGDAARLYGHYVGSSGDGNRGARRARGRGRRPEAGRSRRLRWLLLAGLGPALGIVAVLARRVRRRRTPTVGEALGRALAELLAAFQAALARGRGRR